MRFLNCRSLSFAFIILLLGSMAACKQGKKRVIQSPPHYNFSQVQEKKLDLKLKEISGLAWDRDKEQFLTHYDEKGSLFVLDKGTLDIVAETSFGGKGDYEDIAIYNGVPYILISNGTIIKINRDSAGKVLSGEKVGQLAITGTNDFETMYADTARKALILVCKNCAMDDKSQVSAFAYYPDSIGFVNEPVFKIDANKVKELATAKAHQKTSKLQPSAAAIHPIMKKLFIISSAASQLVICDLDGKPEQVFELGEKLFPQPEGLTFKNDGTMYISNEGVTSKGTILQFRYRL